MRLARLLGLATTLAVMAACSETPTEPPPLDPDLMVAFSNGATVDRLLDGTVLFPTGDPATGLVAVHYTSATLYEGFIGCPVPPFEDVLNVTRVTLPNGDVHNQLSGTMFVRVFDLAGFPGNVFSCSTPIAQGPIEVHGVLGSPPGSGTGRVSSNGVITRTVDGSDVRLHHNATLGISFPFPGTVRLQ